MSEKISTRWVKYRIVTDAYQGYEVRVWRWWWPFWVQPRINTHNSVEKAIKYARQHKNKGIVFKEI